jgi:membrane protein required for colicin V production
MSTINALNPLDWLLTIVLVYSIVRAVLRGFFREAFALGGLILGFLLACWYFQNVAARLGGLLSSPQMAAFLLILFAVMIVATLIGRLLRRSVSAVGLGFVDRMFGGLFGMVRGLLLGVSLLLAIAVFLPSSAWLKTSVLAPYFLRVDHAVSFVMPDDLKQRLRSAIETLKHRSDGWIKSGSPSHTEF